jgi:hypothetical protein
VPKEGAIETKHLAEGVDFHLMSPDRARLVALKTGWQQWLADNFLLPGQQEPPAAPAGFVRMGAPADPDVAKLSSTPDEQDTAVPNGSSIAGILDFDRIRLLLSADAHPRIMAAALKTMGASEDSPLPLDLVKVSHHGSRANTTSELVKLVACERYALSGNGKAASRPHEETLAKIVTFGPKGKILAFNYDHDAAKTWGREHLRRDHVYDVLVPSKKENGTLRIEIVPKSNSR